VNQTHSDLCMHPAEPRVDVPYLLVSSSLIESRFEIGQDTSQEVFTSNAHASRTSQAYLYRPEDNSS